MTSAEGRRRPVHVIESGPAAGVIAAAALARRIGRPNAISIDMGGTTAKASVVEDYQIQRAGEFEIGGSVSQGSRLNKGSGLPAPRPGHRHRRDRGRRRQHRPGRRRRPAARRAAQRRGDPGPGLLRQRRHGGDADRRQRLPRLPPRRTAAERAAARRRARPASRRGPGRGAARPAAPGGGPRRLPARLRADGPRGPRGDRGARPRPARVQPHRVRRQRSAVRGRDGRRARHRDGHRAAGAGRLQRRRPARGGPRAPPGPDLHAPARRGHARRRRCGVHDDGGGGPRGPRRRDRPTAGSS